MIYSNLFKFFQQEHDLLLLDSEIQEIIYEIEKWQKEQQQSIDELVDNGKTRECFSHPDWDV